MVVFDGFVCALGTVAGVLDTGVDKDRTIRRTEKGSNCQTRFTLIQNQTVNIDTIEDMEADDVSVLMAVSIPILEAIGMMVVVVVVVVVVVGVDDPLSC